MKVDASQPLSGADGSTAFSIEQEPAESRGYLHDLRRSCRLVYLTRKHFDEKDWKSAFCSSSFEWINKYPSVLLLYRTALFVVTLVDLVHGIASTRPVHEWAIYLTHLILLAILLAVSFQFLTACRVNFFRGEKIVPRPYVQYVHLTLVIISLGTGLAVSLAYWLLIHRPSMSLYNPRIIFDHGVLWLLFFVDIFVFTRLPVYMIDCVPLMVFSLLYALFNLVVFLFKLNFSNNRVGYIYRAFDLSQSPLLVSLQALVFITFVPVVVIFFLWNLFRLRRAIDVSVAKEGEQSNGNLASQISSSCA